MSLKKSKSNWFTPVNEITERPPEGMQLFPQGVWHTDAGFKVALITPEQLKKVPKDTRLFDIFGEPHVVGVDKIDDDTRGGFLAYGFKCIPVEAFDD